jgi:hypothetical protein
VYQRRQHPTFLFVRAKYHDRLQTEYVHVDGRRAAHRSTRLGDGLHQHRSLAYA